MPKRIDNAKIALLNCPLEIEKTEMSAEIRINQPEQMQNFLNEENRMLKSMVDKIMVLTILHSTISQRQAFLQ
jgi:chaperonin GroEL (HSP60 family)